MNFIYPVLLAGGSGSRLWPLSRKSYPKQFSNLIGEKTLFQESAIRLTSSDIVNFEPHVTLTASDFRFIVGEQLQSVGIDPGNILIEPEAKNTAPAILAASLFISSKNPHAVMIVAPSDHIIPDVERFHKAISTGLIHVNREKMVTFGIVPSKAETGYGYLELSKTRIDDTGVAVVENFIEKPSKSYAEEMLKSGNFLWNAGIFLFKAQKMIDAFKTFAPETLGLVADAVRTATTDLGFLRLNPKHWAEIENISIDYAIMEKAQNLVAVPYLSKWSDLGCWNSVWSETGKDLSGNANSKDTFAIDCSDSLIRSESPTQTIIGLGLTNILASARPDAVLVADKHRSQDVRQVVALLKEKHIQQADIFPKDYRPWGWFESIAIGNSFQVKRICVTPKAALSLQSHKHRSEHWIIVEGTAKVTVDKEVKIVEEGQSIYVPLGAVHRLENPGDIPLILIEVQIGTYLGEDDITRYEDIYKRS